MLAERPFLLRHSIEITVKRLRHNVPKPAFTKDPLAVTSFEFRPAKPSADLCRRML